MKKTESAGGVVKNKEGKILVVSQRGTSWSLPKGHIEQGEDALQASRREIQEEIIEVSVRSPLSSNQISPRTNQRSLFAQRHRSQDAPYV